MQAGSGGVFSEATLCFEPTARTLKPQRPVCTRPITARNAPVRVATTFRCQVDFGCVTVTVTRTLSFARKCAPLTIIGSLADTSLIAGFRVAPEAAPTRSSAANMTPIAFFTALTGCHRLCRTASLDCANCP